MDAAYRDINGHDGYRVGDDGTIWSCVTQVRTNVRRGFNVVRTDQWRQLNGCPSAYGYVKVKLGRGRLFSVHRLVLEAFVGPCPDGMLCRHLDGNKTNNSLANLKWGTARENYEDMKRHGKAVVLSPRPLLSEDDVKAIRLLRGIERAVNVGLRFNVSQWAIYQIWSGRTWSHVK